MPVGAGTANAVATAAGTEMSRSTCLQLRMEAEQQLLAWPA